MSSHPLQPSKGASRPSSAVPAKTSSSNVENENSARPASKPATKSSAKTTSEADVSLAIALGKLFAGAELFKYHQNSLSHSELRIVRVFKAADLPKDATIETLESQPTTMTPRHKGEIYIGYSHLPRSGMAAAFMGKKADTWRVFPLSSSEWVRKGYLSPIFNKAQKQGMPLPNENLCFSILFKGQVTLGLSGKTAADVDAWVSGLKMLAIQAKDAVLPRQEAAAPLPVPKPVKSAAEREAKAQRIAREAAAAAAAADALGSAPDGAWSESDIRAYYEKSLFSSIRAGRAEDVVLAFEGGCPTDIIEPSSGDNVLLAGARAGDVRVVKVALHAAVPFMPNGPKGENALQVACIGGSTACVEAIMRMAAEADDQDQPKYVLSLTTAEGDTPLHLAAAGGFADITKCLLRYSSREVKVRNAADRTPIHVVAACAGSSRYAGGTKRAPTKTALVNGRGAKTIDYEATLEVLLRAVGGGGKILRMGDADGYSPLHLSAAGGALGLVQMFIAVGAPTRLLNAFTSESPFDVANEAGHEACADMIAEASLTEGDAGTTDCTPEAIAAAAAAPEAAAAKFSSPEAKARRKTNKAKGVSFEADAAGDDAQEGNDAEELPEGYGVAGGGGAVYIHPWLQCFDPNSGFPYWYNTDTCESLWEAPAEIQDKLTFLGYQGAWTGAADGGITGARGGDNAGNGLAGGSGSGGGGGGSGGGGGGSGGGGGGFGADGSCGNLGSPSNAQWTSDGTDSGSNGAGGGGTQFRTNGARLGGAPSVTDHENIEGSGSFFSPGRGAARPYAPGSTIAGGVEGGNGMGGMAIPEGSIVMSKEMLAQAGIEIDENSALDGEDGAIQGVLVAGQDAATKAAGRILVLPAHLREKRYMTPGKFVAAAATATAPAVEEPAGESSPEAVADAPVEAIDIMAFPALSRYARMVRMGVPAAPVLEKMKSDGVAAAIITGFSLCLEKFLAAGGVAGTFGTDESAVPAPAPAAVPAAVMQTPAPRAAAKADAAQVPAGTAIFADATVMKYIKMLKMGVPLPPTLMKMRSEGINDAVVAAFEAAVTAHTASGGTMATLGDGASSAVAKPAAIFSDAAVAKYIKMLRMGVPLAPTLLKMQSEGIDASIITAFEAAVNQHMAAGGTSATLGEASAAPSAPMPPSAPPPPPGSPAGAPRENKSAAEVQREAAERVAETPELEKFVKMKKMGVPLGAIKGRMQQDGLSAALIKLFLSAFATHAALETMGLASPKSKSESLDAAPAAAQPAKRGLNTTKIHWDALKLDDAALKKSLWGRIGKGGAGDMSNIGQEDADFLGNMFAAAGAAGGKANAAAAAADANAAATLTTTLDFKRANNLNISLAQFRKFPSAALFSAVYRLDAVSLPRESLEKLAFVLPTPDEIKLVKAFRGPKASLMECDRFFLAVADVPRFGNKVAAFSSTLSISNSVKEAEAKVLLLTGACAQLMESTRLQSVLACVLHIGNVLNAGTKLEGAAAISLDSLGKLQATKAADKKTTLMDALVMLSEKKFGADILSWPDDLKDTTSAARVELPELKSELSRLRASVTAASKEADAEEVDVIRDEAAMKAIMEESESAPDASAAAPAVEAPPAEPVETDPRKAMLAQLMKKRGGDGGAAGGASIAVKPKAAKATPPSNPCTIADRRAFITGIRAKTSAVSASLTSLETLVGVAERAAADLAEYFGEEARLTPPSKVFSTLKGFASNFSVAAAALLKKRAAESKASAAAAAAPVAAAALPPVPPSKSGALAVAAATGAPIRATLGSKSANAVAAPVPPIGAKALAAAPPPPPAAKVVAPK